MSINLTQEQKQAAHDVDTSSMRGFVREYPEDKKAQPAQRPYDIDSSSMRGWTSTGPTF